MTNKLAPPGSTAVDYTPDQIDAITLVDTNLLVSAAAGSGKTAVLSERCAQLVCDPDHGCDVDELLVVTFTEAAASEMRSRIERALRQRLEHAPDDAARNRLRRQTALLERAQIGTLHGFCSRILRENFHLVEIDPSFRILDASEATLLRSETARSVVDEALELDATGAVSALLDDYSNGQDQQLAERLISIFDFLGSVIDPHDWMDHAIARLQEAADGPFNSSKLGQSLSALLNGELVSLEDECWRSMRALESMGGFDGYIKLLNNLASTLLAWQITLVDRGVGALVTEASTLKAERAPAVKAEVPGRDTAKAMLDAVRQKLNVQKGPLGRLLRFKPDEWQAGLKQTLPAARTLLSLVERLAKSYAIEKAAIRAVDFNDLERLSLRVLREDATTLRPSNVARNLQRRFKHVLVDEYQDINAVQDAILSLVSHETASATTLKPNLFCVGDVKQSIYRFRLADPGRFLRRLAAFSQAQAPQPSRVIHLATNFRSRAPLLDSINWIFSRLMTQQAAGIAYDRTHHLVAGRNFPVSEGACTFSGRPIELHVLPSIKPGSVQADADDDDDEADTDAVDMEQIEREASVAALRIHEMLGHVDGQAKQVYGKNGDGTHSMHPIRFGDIAILLRTRKFKAEQLADILRGHGIPTQTDGRGGFFDAVEVRDMLALLKVLDNRRQDVPLAAFLRSPLAGLPTPDDALARIAISGRHADAQFPFHEAAIAYASDQSDELATQLRAVFARLDGWRSMTQRRPLAESIWTIYLDTGYLAYVMGLIAGPQRQANLLELHDIAKRFGTFQRQGLSRFIAHLDKLAEETDLGRPSISTGAEDAVRVMSIHQSKGLEFPVVIIPDIGKGINFTDLAGSVLADRKAYLGLDVMDHQLRARYPSLASALARHEIRIETSAEELRVLYVGMTRAQEHLILIGSAKNGKVETWRRLWPTGADLPVDLITRYQTPLDWLGPLWAANAGDTAPVIELKEYALHDIQGLVVDSKGLTPGLSAASSSPEGTAAAEAMLSRLSEPYHHALHAREAAARSVTSLAKGTFSYEQPANSGEDCPLEGDANLEPPLCVTPALPTQGKDRGTATHLALQHLDFATVRDAQSLRLAVDAMASEGKLSPEQAGLVNQSDIVWLLDSELGRMIHLHVDTIRKELPVYVAAAASREGIFLDDQILHGRVNDTSGMLNGVSVDSVNVTDPAAVATDPADRVMVRGRIDLLLLTDAGLEIVDYKTDRVDGSNLQLRAQSYAEQMRIYALALQKITRQPVVKTHLAFLHARQIISQKIGD